MCSCARVLSQNLDQNLLKFLNQTAYDVVKVTLLGSAPGDAFHSDATGSLKEAV